MAKGDDQFESHFERKREEKQRQSQGQPGSDEPPLPQPVETFRKQEAEPGRNDPCPCGSGKKYKQCCLKRKA